MMFLLFVIASLFFLVPALRLLFLFVWPVAERFASQDSVFVPDPQKSFLAKVGMGLAQYEYYLRPFRNVFITWPLFLGTFGLLICTVFYDPGESGFWLAPWLVLCGVALLQHRHRLITDVRFSAFIAEEPEGSPEQTFGLYKWQMAFGGIAFDKIHFPKRESHTAFNFHKTNRPEIKRKPLFVSLFDTAALAGIAMHAYRVVGQNYIGNVFDALAQLWGKLILWHCQGEFNIKGLENLEGKRGKFIFLFNHKSSFDFILTNLALAHVKINGRFARPRFILAKDHFKDNQFLYKIIGMGQACEAVGMFFIPRKNRKEGIQFLKDLSRHFIDCQDDMVIYPQGTRADGNVSRAGKRWDAGYYTTFTKSDLVSPHSHLKKGPAHLIIDLLQNMASDGYRDPLHLVFVGIKGAGTTWPKNALSVQTENDIQFDFGRVVSLDPALVQDWGMDQEQPDEPKQQQIRKDLVQKFLALIHGELQEILQVNDNLLQRYLTELRGQFHYDEEKLDRIHKLIKEQKTETIYMILDRIYALTPSKWNGYLSQLSQLILEKSSEERRTELLKEVSEDLLAKKKK
ncbi:MAG: 1-acyl-sn-glycerol-3-phosphate acyltransferase [Deltaproteobacteria bacterium]|nr:1-acyl-sn-glycerol-3-phosphate acyltransferase [Deltaproteobacteria bacterium]